MVVVGVLAIRYEWPQATWSLVVESGFTGPFLIDGPEGLGFLDLLSTAVPLTLFAWTFSLSALAPSRAAVVYSWIVALAITGGLLAAGIATERWLLSEANGFVSTSARTCLPRVARTSMIGRPGLTVSKV